jgi:hypothetical protein
MYENLPFPLEKNYGNDNTGYSNQNFDIKSFKHIYIIHTLKEIIESSHKNYQ